MIGKPQGHIEGGRRVKPWTTFSEAAYTDEQRDWLTAILRWREQHGGRQPTLIEAFRLAVSLGYRRVTDDS